MPVAPSARNQSVAGVVTPALPCPAENGSSGRLRYIARSATIGCDAVTIADTSVLASSGRNESTGSVKRARGPIENGRSIGGSGAGRRKRTVPVTAVGLGFCSR